jgi:YHS domain-containing protein/energy-converting hydrogenase Eha subunit C
VAQIINKSNHLRKDIFFEYLKIIVCSIAAIFCLVLAFYTYGFSLIATLILCIYVKKMKVNINILKSGLEGEKQVLELLSDLPKRYKVISDILIQGKNTSSQLDYVIVGSNGIFIVEAKNIKGTITGNGNSKHLTQIKVGKGGREYRRELYNPTFQVRGHMIGLSKLLKRNNLQYDVHGLVYFSNEESKVEFKSNNITVLSKNKDDLLKYIKNYKNNGVKITPNEQIKITKLLKNQVM